MKVKKDEVEHRIERFKATAKAAGVKLTHQRLEIFRVVASSLEHPNAETIFRAVQKPLPTVSLDTVYRTLSMLHELGLITALAPHCANMRFDANIKPHHHYICMRCGLTRDFESSSLDVISLPDAAKGLGSVIATHIEVRGICDTCTKHQNRR